MLGVHARDENRHNKERLVRIERTDVDSLGQLT